MHRINQATLTKQVLVLILIKYEQGVSKVSQDMDGHTNAVTMTPILEVVPVMPESLKSKPKLSAASNVFRHVIEWVRLFLLTEHDNVMDICRIV